MLDLSTIDRPQDSQILDQVVREISMKRFNPDDKGWRVCYQIDEKGEVESKATFNGQSIGKVRRVEIIADEAYAANGYKVTIEFFTPDITVEKGIRG